jgi:hypothetical protein
MPDEYWPDEYWEVTWTDDDPLTRDELEAGELCRGCGRPFFGGPEWVPLLHETPRQRTAREAEDATYRSSHGDCHAGTWTVTGGGIHHCNRYCAPPPIAEETLTRIAQILVRAAQDQEA